MEIIGAEHMAIDQLEAELAQGGRFVMYSWCISAIILTFKNPTSIYFVRAGESRFVKGLPFTAISLVAGWWGFPFGPIFTIWSVVENLSGGRDVTDEVLASIQASYQQQEAQMAAWERKQNEDPYASVEAQR